ncbi:hypothetical protein M5K25_009874 [Dendrobium thyrsiflorum]|uniref:Uncharacterized protein n=1 Tax=Dendrobium thyrsiflorum TaxID=117978 RepID=A0ABD0VDQ6_DENTH
MSPRGRGQSLPGGAMIAPSAMIGAIIGPIRNADAVILNHVSEMAEPSDQALIGLDGSYRVEQQLMHRISSAVRTMQQNGLIRTVDRVINGSNITSFMQSTRDALGWIFRFVLSIGSTKSNKILDLASTYEEHQWGTVFTKYRCEEYEQSCADRSLHPLHSAPLTLDDIHILLDVVKREEGSEARGGGTNLCFFRVFGELFFMLHVLKLIEHIICLINSISQLPYPFVESRVLIADLCLVSGKDDSLDLGVVLSQPFQLLLHARLPSDLLFQVIRASVDDLVHDWTYN